MEKVKEVVSKNDSKSHFVAIIILNIQAIVP